MQDSTLSNRRLNGTVEVQALPKPHSGPRGFIEQIGERHRYFWQPPYQISRLPSWYKLALDCYVGIDGTRRFTLVELGEDPATSDECLKKVATAPGLALVASIGGYRLLVDRGEVKPDLLLTHDEARLFIQYIQHRREYLGRRKALEQFIRLPEVAVLKGRQSKSESILPERMGTTSSGKGERWTVSRFNREARSAAQAAGIPNPTAHQLFSYGLTEAARLNPLHLDSSDAALALVRLALFALPQSSGSVTEEQLRYVAGHVRASLHDHLDEKDGAKTLIGLLRGKAL